MPNEIHEKEFTFARDLVNEILGSKEFDASAFVTSHLCSVYEGDDEGTPHVLCGKFVLVVLRRSLNFEKRDMGLCDSFGKY
jgi:hypothetical protein